MQLETVEVLLGAEEDPMEIPGEELHGGELQNINDFIDLRKGEKDGQCD